MSVALEGALLYAMDSEEDAAPGAGTNTAASEDAAWVARARAGDLEAFEQLVRRYRNDVFGLAYHFVRNREEAWDISQEVFVKAHGALGRFRGEASLRTWLLRITANHCKDFLKRRRLDTVAYDDTLEAREAASGGASPRDRLEAKEVGEAILTALNDLSVKHRTAFVLREFEGLSYEEMAQAMGCSMGTVMSRLHHARKRLQNRLLAMGILGDTTDG